MTNDAAPEPRTLLVEPDAVLRRSWEGALRERGHLVMGTGQKDAAELLAESFRPDLIVWNADGTTGDAGLGSLRQLTAAYVVAAAHDAVSERRATLLAAGADVVIGLPCTMNELLAQAAACLRRPRSEVPRPVLSGARRRFGPLEIDAGRRECVVDGTRLTLTRIEFDLLSHLCNHPYDVVARRELIEAVWGPERDGDMHMVDVHISNLRSKLDRAAPGVSVVQTVRGLGFRLAAEVVDDLGP